MAYNRFRFGVIFRIALLALSLALIIFLIFRTNYVMTVLIVGLVVLYQVYDLIHFVERTERTLTRFLQAVKYEDFFETFSPGRGGVFAETLNREFSRIIQDFRRVRRQREEQYQYLQTVLQHVGIALLSYDAEGRVELINPAAKRLFRRNRLVNIRQLENLDRDLVDALETIRAGQKRTVKLTDEGEVLQLAIHATEFRRQERRYLLVSIQNIGSELEEKELEAWQNLIRVLTHEIRNSITPIASLASTTGALLEATPDHGEEDDTLEDARLAVSTIQKRSQGLLNFVEAFRSLYKIPTPTLATFAVEELFDHLQAFFGQTFRDKGIEVSFRSAPAALELRADPDLIAQVMINLITNAVQALDGRPDPRIEVLARIDARGRARVQVRDNGPGIPRELLDKIFVPFFTTKPEGTGIGLSLSRQILRQHGGTMYVQSTPEKGTLFTLSF